MAMPVVLLSMVFNDSGIGPALVRADHVSKSLWSSAFWANVAIGSFLTIALILLAPFSAVVYGTDEVVPVLLVLSLTVLLQTLGLVPYAWLQREMRFRAIAAGDIFGHVAGFVIAIILAFNGFGVWALVFQQLSIFFVRTSIFWASVRLPALLTFAWSELRPVVSFSVSVTLTNLANLVGRNGDYVILGSVVGAAALGFYSLAYRLMLMPIQIFSWGISSVLLPGLSNIKDDPVRMGDAVLRVSQLVSLITFPIMAGTWALSEPIVIFALGPKMQPVAELLAILAAVGALQSLSSSHGSVFMATGRADIMFRWSLFVNAITLSAFIIGVRWGAVGVASAYLIVNLLLAPPGYMLLFRLIKLPIILFVREMVPTVVVAILMAVAVRLIAQHLEDQSFDHISILMICVPIGVALYAGGVLLLAQKSVSLALKTSRQVLSRSPA